MMDNRSVSSDWPKNRHIFPIIERIKPINSKVVKIIIARDDKIRSSLQEFRFVIDVLMVIILRRSVEMME